MSDPIQSHLNSSDSVIGPRPSHRDVQRHYDRVAPHYDQDYNDPCSRWENETVKYILQRLGFGRCKSVLDIGCGTGLFLDLGFTPERYHGLDISGGMLAELHRKHPGALCLGADFWALNPGVMKLMGAEPYDGVICLFGGLSFSWPRIGFGRSFLSYLEPGGLFAVMLMAGREAKFKWRRDRGGNGEKMLATYYTRDFILRDLRPHCSQVHAHGFNRCVPIGRRPGPGLTLLNALGEVLDPNGCEYLMVWGRR